MAKSGGPYQWMAIAPRSFFASLVVMYWANQGLNARPGVGPTRNLACGASSAVYWASWAGVALRLAGFGLFGSLNISRTSNGLDGGFCRRVVQLRLPTHHGDEEGVLAGDRGGQRPAIVPEPSAEAGELVVMLRLWRSARVPAWPSGRRPPSPP